MLFWSGYIMFMLSLMMWLAKHPLSVGGCILLLYMVGSVVVSFGVSFVAGIFLFLTGVSGMMVAFLYVVALCPNPIFNYENPSEGMSLVSLVIVSIMVVMPLLLVFILGLNLLGGNLNNADNVFQWLRDPVMFGGLMELMPFLGLLLFLCMVSVVVLCGQQKQCLGGHSFSGVKRFYV